MKKNHIINRAPDQDEPNHHGKEASNSSPEASGGSIPQLHRLYRPLRPVKQNYCEYMQAKLSPERAKILSFLQDCMEYIVCNSPLPTTAENAWKKSIQGQIDKTKYGRYYVTLLGGFSSGKSTLINAMIGQELLPVDSNPTTAVQTEIYGGEKNTLFIPMGLISSEYTKKIEKEVRELIHPNSCRIITELKRGNEVYKGIGAEFTEDNIKALSTLLNEISTEKKRKESSKTLTDIKDFLSITPEAPVLVSLHKWPTWLTDIVLTDIPGTGSIHDYHEKIINQVIPHSQLILYILEADKIGSALDKDFCNRISNIHKRKIFYIVNKIDLLRPELQQEALDEVRALLPDTDEHGIKPEILSTSSLYAMESHLLTSNQRTYLDILADEKPNIMGALKDPNWDTSTDSQKNCIVSQFLSKRGRFLPFTEKVENYLRHENKDLALSETASKLIQDFATAYKASCNDKISLLQKQYKVSELEKNREEKENTRSKYQSEANTIINEFENNNSASYSVIYAPLKELFNDMDKKILDTIDKEATNASQLSKLLNNKAEKLQNIIRKEVTPWLKKFEQAKNKGLEAEVIKLQKKIEPIIKKILANKLDYESISGIHTPNADFQQTSISQKEVLGIGALLTSGTFVGLAFAGFGITTTIFGTVTAVFGLPVLVFPPVAATVAIIGGVMWYLGHKKKFEDNKEKLIKQIKYEVLPEIKKTIREEIEKQTKLQVKQLADQYRSALNQLLDEIKQDESNIIAQIAKNQQQRDLQITEWEKKCTEVEALTQRAYTELK